MKRTNVRKLVLLALLIALSVVLTRLLALQITNSLRVSLGNLPILLAGCLLGPVGGMLAGLASDMLGALLLSPLGWYPPLAVSPVLTGLLSGILARALLKRPNYLRCLLLTFACNLLGPMLWTSFWLSKLYGTALLTLLSVRVPLYLCMTAVEALLLLQLYPLLQKRYFPLQAMTYDEALAYIHSTYWRGSRLGLSRTRELLERLGNPQDQLRFVHIAGTNGKGSTAAMLAQILQQSGYRVGLYTSPYIIRFNERIQVNGIPIADEDLAALTLRVRPHAEAMADHPTEFEMITALGMLYFYKQHCDIVVLEVGLGGELDSTNVIKTPEVAVITAIGLDHTRELGGTIGEIASAKAGIIKQGGRVAFYGKNPEAEAVIAAVCEEKSAALAIADPVTDIRPAEDFSGQRFNVGERRDLFLPLLGAYQPENAALAIKTVALLQAAGWRISEENLRKGLALTRWQGRFEILGRAPWLILDGGHNPHGVAGTAESVRLWFPGRRIVCIIGIMADKDVDTVLETLCGVSKEFLAVCPNNARAMSAEALVSHIRALGAEAQPCQTIDEAMQAGFARAAGDPNVVLLAVGSLYMSADIRASYQKALRAKA